MPKLYMALEFSNFSFQLKLLQQYSVQQHFSDDIRFQHNTLLSPRDIVTDELACTSLDPCNCTTKLLMKRQSKNTNSECKKIFLSILTKTKKLPNEINQIKFAIQINIPSGTPRSRTKRGRPTIYLPKRFYTNFTTRFQGSYFPPIYAMHFTSPPADVFSVRMFWRRIVPDLIA